VLFFGGSDNLRSELSGRWERVDYTTEYAEYLEHDIPVYRLQNEQIHPSKEAFVYFWDVPEEEDMGWYIATKVGSEEILGFVKGRSQVPPSSGWSLCPVHIESPTGHNAASSTEELQATTCGFSLTNAAEFLASAAAAEEELADSPPAKRQRIGHEDESTSVEEPDANNKRTTADSEVEDFQDAKRRKTDHCETDGM
jgi:hypothetical protein